MAMKGWIAGPREQIAAACVLPARERRAACLALAFVLLALVVQYRHLRADGLLPADKPQAANAAVNRN